VRACTSLFCHCGLSTEFSISVTLWSYTSLPSRSRLVHASLQPLICLLVYAYSVTKYKGGVLTNLAPRTFANLQRRVEIAERH
jgi:hypothetical protein